MKAKNKVLPPAELLLKVMFIAHIKESLPFSKKGSFNKLVGIFCERYDLRQGGSFYTAGGTFFRKLRFTWEHDGSITIQTYKRGDWELAIDKAYEIAWSEEVLDKFGLSERFTKDKQDNESLIHRVRKIPSLKDDELRRFWMKYGKDTLANRCSFERAAVLMELTKRGIADYKIQGWLTGSAQTLADSPSLLPDRMLRERWADLEWEKNSLEKNRHYWEDKISKGEELEAGGIRVADSPEGVRKQFEVWEKEIEEKEKALKEEMMKRGLTDADAPIERKRRAPRGSDRQGML